jgi:hypothetical protein
MDAKFNGNCRAYYFCGKKFLDFLGLKTVNQLIFQLIGCGFKEIRFMTK